MTQLLSLPAAQMTRQPVRISVFVRARLLCSFAVAVVAAAVVHFVAAVHQQQQQQVAEVMLLRLNTDDFPRLYIIRVMLLQLPVM